MTETVYVDNPTELARAIVWLLNRGKREIAVDTETTSTDWDTCELRLFQFGAGDTVFVVPAGEWLLPIQRLVERGPSEELVAHNWKYDAHVLERHGWDIELGRWRCSQTVTRLARPDRRKISLSAAMAELGLGHFDKAPELKARFRETKTNYATIPLDDPVYVDYAGSDVHGVIGVLLADGPNANPDVYEREMRSQRVLYRMERRGMPVDVEYCIELSKRLGEGAGTLVETAAEQYGVVIAGKGSRKSTVDGLLARGHALPKTKTGHSIAAEVLDGLEDDDGLAQAIKGHRRLTKIKSTWIDPFIEATHPDGRMYPSVNPVGTVTGRMSSKMHTLPRTAMVRRAIAAPPGKLLIACDFSQQELRIIAMVTGDENLIAACNSGDAHTQNAKLLFSTDAPTPVERQFAKNAIFSLFYGAGDATISGNFGIAKENVAAMRLAANENFPRAMNLIPIVERSSADFDGDKVRAVNPFGRLLECPGRLSYMLGNHMVQSIGADVLKDSMIRLEEAELDEYAILPVHDEILAEVPEDEAADIAKRMEEVMRDDRFSAPLVTEANIVRTWGDKYE